MGRAHRLPAKLPVPVVGIMSQGFVGAVERRALEQFSKSLQKTSGSRQFVKVFDVRTRGAIYTLHLGVAGLDHVIFVGSVGAASVAQAEMSCGQPQGIAGEDVSGPGAGQTG